jgi:hypothetical protein
MLAPLVTPGDALSLAGAAQFQVNTHSGNVQARPDIAAGEDGSFLVVWRNFDETPVLAARFKIQGRLFGPDGVPEGPDFILDGEDPAGCNGGRADACRRDEPAVAVGPAGEFVVVWKSVGHTSSFPVPSPFAHAVLGRRFASDGTPMAPEFVVRSVDRYFGIGTPDVDFDAGGGFVVAWVEDPIFSYDMNLDIFAQRFDASGAPLGTEFQVNTFTTGSQTRPSVAGVPDGGYVVVWQSQGSAGTDDSGTSIQARRYDAAGAPAGSQFQVNTYTTGMQLHAAIGVDSEGDAVIVWESWGTPGGDPSAASIQAQRFSPAGAPVGEQFRIDQATLGQQRYPAIAVEPDGDFLVAWWSDGTIRARPFDASGSPLAPDLQINSAGIASHGSPTVAAVPGGEYVIAWGSDVGSAGDFLDAIEARRLTADWLFVDGFETGDSSRWSVTAP